MIGFFYPIRQLAPFLSLSVMLAVVSCGGGNASIEAPNGADTRESNSNFIVETTTSVSATAIPFPTPAPTPSAVPTATVKPMSAATPRPTITAPIGSDLWWNGYASFDDFMGVWPEIPGIDEDAAWSLYAALFVASDWLSGHDPRPETFGSYVASLQWAEVPMEATRLFNEIGALPFPSTEEWVRPYQNPQTAEESSLVFNLAFGACLDIATWQECVARAEGG